MAAKKREKSTPEPEKLSFEQCVEELEAIIEKIESGAFGLDESLERRRRGDALIKRCRAILDTAEQEIRQISAEEKAAGDD